MEYLVLRGNRIWDISPLAGMTDLQYLNVAYNLLSSVSPLAELHHLQSLELYLNPLSSISSLTGSAMSGSEVVVNREMTVSPIPCVPV